MSFQSRLQLIKDGEPVKAGTPNRPLSQLLQNEQYLRDMIEAAALGSTVYAREVTVDSSVVVGTPVYFNTGQQKFMPALANVETDSSTGLLLTSLSSQVWGICAVKHHATLADLLLFGYAQINITPALGGAAVTPGLYYLSASKPGVLTTQRPPISVPVLKARDSNYVFVNPKFVDFLEAHRHFRFELTCAPAGDHTPPIPGDRHTITNPDSELPGWLPYDDDIFEGNAPPGAVFGYNLSQHSALQNAWPPLPLEHVSLEWDRGLDAEDGYNGVPLGSTGLCVIDRNGIWWMSNCWNDVPWPRDLDTSEPADSESVSEGVVECPRELTMSLALWFSKLQFGTDAVVTSLTSKDARLKIYCSGTSIAGTTGDLDLDLDLELTLGDDDNAGYLAFKTLDGQTIHRGPVASGIYAASDNVVLASQLQTTVGGTTIHHGRVGITVQPAATRELQPQIVRLQGATEEHYPVLYLGFADENTASFIAKFDVPTDAPSGSKFAWRAELLGRAAGTLPPLTVEYLKVSRPAGLDSPVAVGSTWTAITFDGEGTLTSANQVVEATSATFNVTAGDTVFIRVTRTPDAVGDGYASEVGVMQQTGVLTSS